jgi:hypothetical protein
MNITLDTQTAARVRLLAQCTNSDAAAIAGRLVTQGLNALSNQLREPPDKTPAIAGVPPAVPGLVTGT